MSGEEEEEEGESGRLVFGVKFAILLASAPLRRPHLD